MLLEIEHEKSFALPEGEFKAKLVEVKTATKFKNGKLQNFIRLVFEILNGEQSPALYAGRNFLPSLGKTSKLREFIESWVGREPFSKHSVRNFDVRSLIGREGRILIKHIHNGEHLPPFRQIAAIYPALTGQPSSTINQ